MSTRILIILSILAVLLMSACAPPDPPVASQPSEMTSETDRSNQAPESSISAAEQAAKDIAADELTVEPNDVTVLEVQSREWPDASLGCPQPDMMYAQMLTSGYIATVEIDGETYDVHMDTNGNGFVCLPEK